MNLTLSYSMLTLLWNEACARGGECVGGFIPDSCVSILFSEHVQGK